MRWEIEGVNLGVERYRSIMEAQPNYLRGSVADLEGRVLPALSLRILALQDRALAALTKAGPKPDWAEPLTRLPAVDWAAITFRAVMRAAIEGQGSTIKGAETSLRSVALTIARAARTQMEFHRIADNPKSKKDADRDEPDDDTATPEKFDAMAILRARKLVDRAYWPRFAASILKMREKPMTPGQSVAVGAMLLDELIEASGGAVCARLVSLGPCKDERRIFIADAAIESLCDIEAVAEVARPWLLPMIIPPNPWKHEGNPNEI